MARIPSPDPKLSIVKTGLALSVRRDVPAVPALLGTPAVIASPAAARVASLRPSGEAYACQGAQAPNSIDTGARDIIRSCV
jgi:hypothetical protein